MRHRVPAWVVPTVITLAAAVLLFVRLGQPDAIIFDEVYYVEDARSILDRGVEAGFAVHPPVGKWLIATGIALFGDAPFGWRAAGAFAGAVTVFLTVLIARRLTGRPGLGALAGGLLALDGVFVVQARTAMLDIFLAGSVVLGAYLLVVDHQRGRPAMIRSRWPLVLAGVAFGAAVATKWSGVLALVPAAVLVGGWELRHRRARHDGPAGAPRGRAAAAVVTVVGLGLVVPALVTYLLAWTPWMVRFELTQTAQAMCEEARVTGPAGAEEATDATCPTGAGQRLRGLARHHVDVAGFHNELDAEHPYRAPATTWPVQARPVVYHWDACDPDGDLQACTVAPGNATEVIGLGNPALWWGGLLLLPFLVAGAVGRDRRSVVPLAFLAGQYLPWLVVARPVFSFYAVPLVPFLAIAVAVVCGELDRPRQRLLTVCGTVVGAALGALGATLAGRSSMGVGGVAGVAGLAGAALGGVLDARHDRRQTPTLDDAPRGTPVGTYLAVAMAALAVVAAVYFAPIWLAIELPEQTIRQRWWFPGWI
jgi:dolichyl-phosphate-mannose-protein mannosyltransferase